MKTLLYKLFGVGIIREPFLFEPHLFLANSSGQIEWLSRTAHAKIIAHRIQTMK